MEIATILIALAIIFVVWKVVAGLIKWSLILAVVLGAVWLVANHGTM